jgi:two-component system chemotaxis response regulator CheY
MCHGRRKAQDSFVAPLRGAMNPGASEMQSPAALVDPQLTDNRRIRVLIADDEPHIRSVINRIVTSLGAEVVAEADDGEQAVRLFEATRPELAILDINMPRLTGDQVLARMLEIDPRVLAIMMTAQDAIGGVRACLDLGARDYILKSNPAEEIFRLMGESWGEYVAEILAGRAS